MTDEQMQRWLASVCAELGLSPEVLEPTTGPLLDLVRDVAHGPSRPAAPLTAFLVGLAAGRHRGSADLGETVLAQVTALEGLLDREA